MSFDPMAAAVDWLDAYRAGDLENLLDMYADEAAINCGCGGMKTITGRAGLRAYWTDRLREYPASNLENLQPIAEGASISYSAPQGVVSVLLTFNWMGLIILHSCGPSQ